MGAQLNLKPKVEDDSNVLDFDDLWVKHKEHCSTTPSVYVRQNQENEIDVLWSNLKDSHKQQTPPLVYVGIGFFAGILLSFVVTTILFWDTNNKATEQIDLKPLTNTVSTKTQKSSNVSQPLNNVRGNLKTQYKDIVDYTIKPGDSLGGIAKKFYHSSTPEYVNLIQEANNLKTPHGITAGKKLIIPVKK